MGGKQNSTLTGRRHNSGMSYTVKLATFPHRKAPIPYEMLAGTFATIEEAHAAAMRALESIMSHEVASIMQSQQPQSDVSDERKIVWFELPTDEGCGFLIFDESGVEVGNWTSWDEAMHLFTKDR